MHTQRKHVTSSVAVGWGEQGQLKTIKMTDKCCNTNPAPFLNTCQYQVQIES